MPAHIGAARSTIPRPQLAYKWDFRDGRSDMRVITLVSRLTDIFSAPSLHEQSALGLTASNIECYVTLPLSCSDFIQGKLQSAIKTDLQMAFEEVVRETIHSASTMSSMRMVITCTFYQTRIDGESELHLTFHFRRHPREVEMCVVGPLRSSVSSTKSI